MSCLRCLICPYVAFILCVVWFTSKPPKNKQKRKNGDFLRIWRNRTKSSNIYAQKLNKVHFNWLFKIESLKNHNNPQNLRCNRFLFLALVIYQKKHKSRLWAIFWAYFCPHTLFWQFTHTVLITPPPKSPKNHLQTVKKVVKYEWGDKDV